jgi:hypothetical protein
MAKHGISFTGTKNRCPVKNIGKRLHACICPDKGAGRLSYDGFQPGNQVPV